MKPPTMKPIDRRSVLRGAGGVAVSLPFLDAMLPRRQAHAAPPPQRLFTFFTENGVVERAWYPTGDEKDFTLGPIPPILAPFDRAQLKRNLILIQGLDQYGQRGDAHRAGRAGCLTSQIYLNTAGISFAQGISLDQAVASHVGASTCFRSLEAGVLAGRARSGGIFYSGPNQAIPAEDDPAKLFARVFSDGVTCGGAASASQDFARLHGRKKSILDRALDEYKRVQAKVAPADRQRLEVHAEAIRQVERRLSSATPAAPAKGCAMPAAPAAATDFRAIGKAQLDLLALALACDLTRVASIQWHSHDTVFGWVGARDLHHTLAHAQGSAEGAEQIIRIVTWFAEQAVYVIERLKAFGEAGGDNLFDRTLFFWPFEMAIGNHRLSDAPYLLASGGKLADVDGKPLVMGRFLKLAQSLPHSALLTSIGRVMGLPISNFGDPQWHKGPLPGLV